MKQIIRILSYKKVKTDKVYDIVKAEDIVFAEVNESDGRAFILSGKYNGKYIERFDKDYQNFDYTYDIINTKLIEFERNIQNEEELLKEAISLYSGHHFYVDEVGETLGLRVCIDKTIIEAFKQFQNPSIANELGALIEDMKNSGSEGFTIPPELTSKLLGKTDTLEQQDVNQYKSILEYDIKGKYKKLKEIVVGQDKQLKILLANLIKNMSLSYSTLNDQEVKNLKSKILLIGGTGTGKTLMIENIAEMLEVPFIIADAKRYTSNGYIGEDVENMLVDLYRASNNNPEKFKHGIIFIDEVDKLCNVKDEKSHVATTDVQEALLKIIEGSKITKIIQKGFSTETLVLDTSRITFVLAGAFNDLSNEENYDNDETLIKAGMIPELVGRLNTKVITNKPTKEQLKEALLNSKYSYLNLLKEYFEIYGIEVEISESFIDEIVTRAYDLDQGYRSLAKIINIIVDEQLFDIYAGDIKKLTLDN